MKIYEYLDTRVDPMTLRKINFYLMLDDEGEPYIKIEYIDENKNKIDIFSTSEEIKGVSDFANKVTKIIRDECEADFNEVKPIVYDNKTGYFKYNLSPDQRIPQEIYVKNVYSEDVLLGLVIEPKKSAWLKSEQKVNMLLETVNQMMHVIKDKNFNCELHVDPEKQQKLSQ